MAGQGIAPPNTMKGRFLVDCPHGKCGEYGEVPQSVADELIAAGVFDPRAVTHEETAAQPQAAKKPARKGKE